MTRTPCLLLSLALGAAAAPLDWERLVASASQEPALQAADKKLSLVKAGGATKLWDDLEFRYEADGLGLLKHDFELRVKPAPLGEAKAVRAYWQSQQQYEQAKRCDVLSDLRYERYQLGLRYVALKAHLGIRNQLVTVNQDRIQVLLALSGSENFDPAKLVEAQGNDADLRAEVLEDLDLLDEITQQARLWVPDFNGIELDSSWLPSVESIQASLEKHAPQVDSTYPGLAKAHEKYKAGKARLDLESSGDKAIVQYIGVGYSWTIAKKEYDYVDNQLTDELVRKEDNSRIIDRWNVGVGFRLPFFDSKGDDQVRRQVDLLDRESEYLAEKRDLEHKVARIREEIGALLEQRKVLQEFSRQVDAGSLFKDYAVRAGSDPLLLLKARESSLLNELRAVKLEYEIYDRYLSLLQYSGVLAKNDVQNHLAAGITP